MSRPALSVGAWSPRPQSGERGFGPSFYGASGETWRPVAFVSFYNKEEQLLYACNKQEAIFEWYVTRRPQHEEEPVSWGLSPVSTAANWSYLRRACSLPRLVCCIIRHMAPSFNCCVSCQSD